MISSTVAEFSFRLSEDKMPIDKVISIAANGTK